MKAKLTVVAGGRTDEMDDRAAVLHAANRKIEQLANIEMYDHVLRYNALRDIGETFFRAPARDEALEYYSKALLEVESHSASFSRRDSGTACRDVAKCLNEVGRLEEAERYYRKGLDHYGGVPADPLQGDVDGMQSSIIWELAENLAAQRKAAEAEPYYCFLLDAQLASIALLRRSNDAAVQAVSTAIDSTSTSLGVNIFATNIAHYAIEIARMRFLRHDLEGAKTILIEQMPPADSEGATKLLRNYLLRVVSDLERGDEPPTDSIFDVVMPPKH